MSSSEHTPARRFPAIEVIRNEHRAMAAILDALSYIVRNIEAGRLKPDFVLLASMVDYFAEMPDKLHHPKENRIFAALRAKTSELDEYLDALEENHRTTATATGTMDRGLVHYLQGGTDAFIPFRDAVRKYVNDEFEHMGIEERRIFPYARQFLTPEDWKEIDADFARNSDPWRGLDDRFVKLFRQIANLAPAPIGLGDAH